LASEDDFPLTTVIQNKQVHPTTSKNVQAESEKSIITNNIVKVECV